MSRLTITLDENRYRALKQAAAQRGTSMGQLINDSLAFYGIKTRDEASDLLRRARDCSGLSEDDATALAVSEVRAQRGA